MKKTIKIISAVVISIWITACYDVFENKGIEDYTVQNGITKKEAAEVFQQKIRNYETLKGKGNLPVNPLLPSDYTPQWSDAVYSENEYIWSIEAPIISSKQLKTSHTDEKQPWSAAISQKVVIIKNKETNNTEMFVLSLIPDKECFTKHRSRRERLYTHVGDNSKFTGTVVYTLWEGTDIIINEHTGKKTERKFKHARQKPFKEQIELSNGIIRKTGDMVLMSADGIYGGEIEASIVIGKEPESWCHVCWFPISSCICWLDDVGYDDDYTPPPYYRP
ncbi:MAG: hypothetical protein LBE11_03895 [Prevotellaceae bacterium]|nr:hypothetical protein [Prevotellaceae bacterium]